ncbi:hypothetical protein H9P43_001776 [Blastocladiella emersonii ATCC 22665]|nr:hypothetical protein H9P43_001776 [Blastocladiella emersonii ATCC 22665]
MSSTNVVPAPPPREPPRDILVPDAARVLPHFSPPGRAPRPRPSTAGGTILSAVCTEPTSAPIPVCAPDAFPPLGTLRIRLARLELFTDRVRCRSPLLRVAIGGQRYSTLVRDDPDDERVVGGVEGKGEVRVAGWAWGDRFDLRVDYHTQLFSTIQIDVLNAHMFVSDTLKGRTELRIADLAPATDLPLGVAPAPVKRVLPIFDPNHAPSRRPHVHLSSLLHRSTAAEPPTNPPPCTEYLCDPKVLGTLSVEIWYQHQSLHHVQPDRTVQRLLSPKEVSGVSQALLEGTLRALSLSQATRETLRQLFRLLGVFRQGMDTVSVTEWICGVLLLMRYYEAHPISRSNQVVVNRSLFAALLHYKQYAMAAYGWMGLVYFGKSMVPSDRLSMAAILSHVDPGDWLSTEIGTGEVFQPSHFVVHDRRENSLVIAIRGTLSSVDAVTDLICEYVRFGDGMVHRGMKVAAEWLSAVLSPQLVAWVRDRGPEHLVVVGHSLGAGTACLLTMLLNDTLMPALQELVPRLDLHCYAFAPPPVCSANLADEYSGLITAVVNEHDLVCRLSYGAVVDLRTCLLTAVGLVEDHTAEILRLISKAKDDEVAARLADKFDVITELYIPGTIYHIHYVAAATLATSPPTSASSASPSDSPTTAATIPLTSSPASSSTSITSTPAAGAYSASAMGRSRVAPLSGTPAPVAAWPSVTAAAAAAAGVGIFSPLPPADVLVDDLRLVDEPAGSLERLVEEIALGETEPAAAEAAAAAAGRPMGLTHSASVDQLRVAAAQETPESAAAAPKQVRRPSSIPSFAPFSGWFGSSSATAPARRGSADSASSSSSGESKPVKKKKPPAVRPMTRGTGSVVLPVIEATPRDLLAELLVRRNMFADHLPSGYERALKVWLSGDADQLGVDA